MQLAALPCRALRLQKRGSLPDLITSPPLERASPGTACADTAVLLPVPWLAPTGGSQGWAPWQSVAVLLGTFRR